MEKGKGKSLEQDTSWTLRHPRRQQTSQQPLPLARPKKTKKPNQDGQDSSKRG
jgi:hypothetical protein